MIWDVAGRFFFFKIFPEVFPSSFSLKNYKYLLPVNSLLLPVYQSVKLRWKNLQKWFKASKCEWVIYSRSCRKSHIRRFFSFSFILKKTNLCFYNFYTLRIHTSHFEGETLPSPACTQWMCDPAMQVSYLCSFGCLNNEHWSASIMIS